MSGLGREQASNAEQAMNGARILLQPETEVVELHLLRYSAGREEETMPQKQLLDEPRILQHLDKWKLLY